MVFLVMTPAERIPAFVDSQGIHRIPDSALSGGAVRHRVRLGGVNHVLDRGFADLLGSGLLVVVFGRPVDRFPPNQATAGSLSFSPPLSLICSPAHPWRASLRYANSLFSASSCSFQLRFRSVARFRKLLDRWTGSAYSRRGVGFAQVLATPRGTLWNLKWNTDYDYYLDDRIKGFSSHWMTFGGEQMIALLMLFSFLLFACPRRWRSVGWCCGAYCGFR